MLHLLTKSKIRRRILLLFVYNPGKAYYINEIAKRVSTSSGTAQRELEKLVSSGILTKERKANLVYFTLNTASNIIEDIKSIIDKTIGIEYLLREAFEEDEGVEYMFLFGSYIKGDFKSRSDIDLYVIGTIGDEKLHKKIKDVELVIDRSINYHASSTAEFKEKLKKSFFHKEIVDQCKLILGNEDEFRAFIG